MYLTLTLPSEYSPGMASTILLSANLFRPMYPPREIVSRIALKFGSPQSALSILVQALSWNRFSTIMVICSTIKGYEPFIRHVTSQSNPQAEYIPFARGRRVMLGTWEISRICLSDHLVERSSDVTLSFYVERSHRSRNRLTGTSRREMYLPKRVPARVK